MAAQVATTLDAGGASVHYDGFLRSSVWTVTPSLFREGARSTVAARATGALFETGHTSLGGVIAGSLLSTARDATWRGEISGVIGGTAYRGSGSGYGVADARLHWVRGAGGAWLGGGGGATSAIGITDGVGRGEIGGWLRANTFAFTATLSATRIRAARFDDAELQAHWGHGRLELLMNAGARLPSSTATAHQTADLAATVWLTSHLAIVAAHGRYASDPVSGSPGGGYTAFALRLASRPPILREALMRAGRPSPPPLAAPVVRSFDVRSSGDTRRIRVSVASARRVEIAGDFTDWEPKVLTSSGPDTWEVALAIPPGRYRFNLRVDGGSWGVPPGVTVGRDDFGGVVGWVVVK